MYIQITDRCNMSCAHCSFSCGPVGTDMSWKVFKAACDHAAYYGEYIAIGGGEPTLHKNFWKFFGYALGSHAKADSEFQLFIATNGTNREIALALAAMAKAGVIHAALSIDEWHDPIDTDIEDAFRKPTRSHHYGNSSYDDLREIRTVERPYAIGRAKSLYGRASDDGCPCDDIIVDPTGKLWACAHKTMQFGTIFKPEIPAMYYDWGDKCSAWYEKHKDFLEYGMEDGPEDDEEETYL